MFILAIDTATEATAVALLEDETLYGDCRINRKFTQSQKLVSLIDSLIQHTNLPLQKLDGIAVSTGPGSYTGLRIGLSVAKGLAFSLNIPITGVNSLDALAYQVEEPHKLICPMIRFRKEEFYLAFYRQQNGRCQRCSDYEIYSATELPNVITEKTILVGSFSPAMCERLQELLGNQIRFAKTVNTYANAYAVGLLGVENLRQGRVENIQQLEPFYMREFPLDKNK